MGEVATRPLEKQKFLEDGGGGGGCETRSVERKKKLDFGIQKAKRESLSSSPGARCRDCDSEPLVDKAAETSEPLDEIESRRARHLQKTKKKTETNNRHVVHHSQK